MSERYQRQHNKNLGRVDFISIQDCSQGAHNPFFTSLFVCPITGECFLSGNINFGDNDDGVLTMKRMTWYTSNKAAEFAAVGRAEDNFAFRDTANTTDDNGRSNFCSDGTYYRDEDAPSIAPFVEAGRGSGVESKVRELQQQGRLFKTDCNCSC